MSDKINLDKHVKEIEKDLALRGHMSIKAAGFLDVLTIIAFWVFIIWSAFELNWYLCLALFATQTIWKISIALQDITRAVHVLNIFALINTTKNKP